VRKNEKKVVGGRVLARTLAEELKRVSGADDESGDVVVTKPNPRLDVTQVSLGDKPAI
jgi:hypothetical protein